MPDFPGLLFYLFGAVLLLSAVGVVTLRNPVHCALLLVVSFLSAACLWILLGAEFLAVVLVLVYVGAVMVLFLFVVMMLDIKIGRLREGLQGRLLFGLAVAAMLAAEMYFAVNSGLFGADAFPGPASPGAAAHDSNTLAIGRLLYTDYLLVFEAAAVVLLIAMVAAIAITLRRRTGGRTVDPADQVAVRPGERLRVLKIDAVRVGTDGSSRPAERE